MNPLPFPPASHLVAYLRDSGGDDQDLSLSQQEEVVRAWCAENGYILDHIFRDSSTGTTTLNRRGFEEMITFFRQKRKPNVAGLVIWRNSRFSRDMDDAQYYKADLRRRGFKIHSMRDIVPEGIDGRFFETAYDWKSAKDIEILSDEVKRGQRHLVRNYGALGGTPPKGFMREEQNIGTRRDGRPHIVARWVPDPTQWETCRTAWHMRASGASYREINAVTHLFASLNSYHAFFRNRLYRGELQFGGEIIPNYVTPLIDEATWAAVQALNAESNRTIGPENPHNAARGGSSYLLSGIAFCTCGAPLNGATVAFKNGYRREYYKCSRSKRAPQQCQGLRIPKDILETAVLDNLAEYILSPDNLAAQQAELRADHRERAGETAAKRAELAHQLANANRSLSNIAAAIAAAGHTPTLLAKLRELETLRTQLDAQIIQLDDWLSAGPQELTIQQIDSYASALRSILTSGDLPTRRTVISGVVDRVIVERVGIEISITIQYYQPPADLVNGITGPSPPHNGLYAYVHSPLGGTQCKHKLFTHRSTVYTKKHP